MWLGKLGEQFVLRSPRVFESINRASVQTVVFLANVLGYQAEDLLEYSTAEDDEAI